MPISKSANLIFVHIPKTGGSSFEKLVKNQYTDSWQLWGDFDGWNDSNKTRLGNITPKNLDNTDGSPQRYLQHLSISDIRKAVSADFFNNAAKVSIIRNPWDRLVSFYEYNYQTLQRMGTKGKSFKQWFYNRSISPNLLSYLTIDGSIPIDLRLINFDNYEIEMQNFASELKVPWINGIHEKKTMRLDYRTYYDDIMAEELEKECKKDIEAFNFTFDLAED